MAHSADDVIIPYHHGQELFKTAGDPKTFVELRGSHGPGFWETGERYRSALKRFLNKNLKAN